MKLKSLVILVIAAMVLPIMAAPAYANTATATLAFERQGLDLDTGTVYDRTQEGSTGDLFVDHPEADLQVAYHADRWPHAVLVQNQSTGHTGFQFKAGD